MDEIYKKWWFWVIVIFGAFILIGLYPKWICHSGGGETATREAVKHCHNLFTGTHFH